MGNSEKTVELAGKIIKFIEEETTGIDGPYKAAALKTAASYFENLTHAESMMTILTKTFTSLN